MFLGFFRLRSVTQPSLKNDKFKILVGVKRKINRNLFSATSKREEHEIEQMT